MLTKEKIDKQLAGQSSSTPFMNIRESQGKKVSFNIQDNLEHKIDRLMVMMDKLVTEDGGCSKPFKPQVYQPGRVEIKIEETFMVDLEIMHIEDL